MSAQTVVQRLRLQAEVGLFDVPAGHQHVTCSDAADAIEAANAAAEGLAKALEGVRGDLHNENGLNTLSIADVIWHSEIETTVDFIDAALAAYRAGAA